jgi:hypothetical protein
MRWDADVEGPACNRFLVELSSPTPLKVGPSKTVRSEGMSNRTGNPEGTAEAACLDRVPRIFGAACRGPCRGLAQTAAAGWAVGKQALHKSMFSLPQWMIKNSGWGTRNGP